MSPLPSPEPDFALGILPTLPTIQSEEIRKQVFTHSSMVTGQRRNFQAPQSDPGFDNKRLGHIGDQVFGLAVTDLIQTLYPSLRVGPSSKVRDYVKCKGALAEVSVLYGLHKRLGLPECQARRLRASQSVQMDVFKAFVGGLYKDQGLDVVREWLTLLFKSRVEAAYQVVRGEYLLTPVSEVTPRAAEPTVSYPPSPSFTPSHSTEHTIPSGPAEDPGQSTRRILWQVNLPQQGSGLAHSGIGAGSEGTDQPGDSLSGLPPSQRGGGCGDASKQGRLHREGVTQIIVDTLWYPILDPQILRRDDACQWVQRRSGGRGSELGLGQRTMRDGCSMPLSSLRPPPGLLTVERRTHRRRTQRGERELEGKQGGSTK
ncbi:ribonuclease III domain-containing protein [Lactifluus subvellereus]|nr:ribonuclease III domain-containing protein [Lactifluus subvellereus]